MRLLLDSHTLLWWLSGNPKLSTPARDALADGRNSAFVSASVAWEISTKHRLGKLPEAEPLLADFLGILSDANFDLLAVNVPHGLLAGRLENSHKDPFDRMLIAQALLEGLALVSNETLFDAFGVSRIW